MDPARKNRETALRSFIIMKIFISLFLGKWNSDMRLLSSEI